MSDLSKPVIVFVPGAWHLPSQYSRLFTYFNKSSYETATDKNTSCDSDTPNSQTAAVDAAAIRANLILPQINAGRDVVIVMHSYGGNPGDAAAKGLSKTERQAAGQIGGVIGLIFICAFIAKEGDSVVSQLPNQKLDSWIIHNEETGQLSVENSKEMFYNDLPEELAAIAVERIKKQSYASLNSPSPPTAWPDSVYDGRRSYFHALQDRVIPYFGQEMMLKGSGVEWNVKLFESGHSPFLSHPTELGEWVVEQVEMYRKL